MCSCFSRLFGKAVRSDLASISWRRNLSSALLLRPVLQAHQTQTYALSPRLAFRTPCARFSQSSNCNKSDSLVHPSTENEKLYKAIDVFVKGHEAPVLHSYITFCVSAAKQLDITVHRVFNPKFIADRMTLLKSKHIFKKHRVQYEIRTHKKVLQLKRLTGSTADVYLEYVQRNLPAGVAMHVRKWEMQRIPEHIQEEMSKNLTSLTNEDWKRETNLMKKMYVDQSQTKDNYEEYQTLKRFLIGTTS